MVIPDAAQGRIKNDIMPTPLYTIGGVDSGGLTEEHWHFAYSVFHGMMQKRHDYHPYPVKLVDSPSPATAGPRMITQNHVHFPHNDTHVEQTEMVKGKGSFGTAYLGHVYTKPDKSDVREVVIKVSVVQNPEAVEPQPASASGWRQELQTVVEENKTWYLDTAVLEPLTMAVLQRNWTQRFGADSYPCAKFLCSFLVAESGTGKYQQVTVMSFEPGVKVYELGKSFGDEVGFLEYFRQMTWFVYTAWHELNVGVLDRSPNNAIWKPAENRAVQLDFGLCSCTLDDDQVYMPWPDGISKLYWDPDPMRSMRLSWAHYRSHYLKQCDFGQYIEKDGLRAAVEARKYPWAWLFDSVIERAQLDETVASAFSVVRKAPEVLDDILYENYTRLYTMHDYARATKLYCEEIDFGFEKFFAPLDYSATSILQYGVECALYLVNERRDEAVNILDEYVNNRQLPIKSYLPMLLFAMFVAEEELGMSLDALRFSYHRRKSLVSLLPAVVQEDQLTAALMRLSSTQQELDEMVDIILHALEPVAKLTAEQLYDDEREAVEYFADAWRYVFVHLKPHITY